MARPLHSIRPPPGGTACARVAVLPVVLLVVLVVWVVVWVGWGLRRGVVGMG